MKYTLDKPDTFGALASTLCIVHCVATPFLFVVQSCALHGCDATPSWWKNLDFLFLVVSFFAVNQSVKTTAKSYMKPLLWINWSLLCFVLVNEKMHWLSLSEYVTYAFATSLAVIHVYNLKYCQCKSDTCCSKKTS